MNTCPKCKSDYSREADNGQQYHCGSVSCPDGSFIESWYCLRRQVRQQQAEKKEAIAALEVLLADVMNLGSFSITSRPSVQQARSAIKNAQKEKP